ncbi:MAG: hypothetical protein DRH57_02495 [Candidatus Cloacimonadota bacterium]|nr:MAG: hypothetical protein DRH57_02495 [Candidatus Cloacimonadota bacterium]
MNFFERMQNLDRRYIFILVAVAVILPLIFPLGLPTYPTPPVESMFQHIDAASNRKDKAILMSIAHDPSTMPELYPMEISMLRHCFERNIKVFLIGFFPQAAAIAEMALKEVLEDYPDKSAGVDYCNFGFKPSAIMIPIILGMGDDISKAIETDAQGNKLENLPIMQNIKNYDNIQMVVEFSGGSFGGVWITYARAKFGVDVGCGITAVIAAQTYPYLQTGQLKGSLGGLKGAAEYEKLVDIFAKPQKTFSRKKLTDKQYLKQFPLSKTTYKYKKARIGMDAQAVVHIMIIVFIILGNIGYFVMKGQKK